MIRRHGPVQARGETKPALDLLTEILANVNQGWADICRTGKLEKITKAELDSMLLYLENILENLSLFIPARDPSYGISERGGVLDERGRESWRLAERQRHALRCLFRHDGGAVSSASRLELTLSSGQRGWLLGQTLSAEPWRGLRLSVSVGLFRAPSYDVRIVMNEPDLSAPRFLLLSGSGVRTVLSGRLRVAGLGIGLKAATMLRGFPSSSGGRERTTELAFQLDGAW